jgi:hypothetical protein
MHRDPEASYRLLCTECLKTKENNIKEKWLMKLRKDKTLEQRVEFIEEFIYNVINEIGEQPDLEIK